MPTTSGFLQVMYGQPRSSFAFVGLVLCLIVGPLTSKAETFMTVLAEIGPWPAVSRLIGFEDRLWFANSVKGRNHNSADLYSYGPEEGDLRYERHLFSQDAGRPAVAGGLLYWPFEDARFSLGHGHFMATDGDRWHEGIIPTGRIFHTHAMAATAATDQLVAATSAWRAHLDLSSDGGLTWRQVHDHPTPGGRVSRIVDLVVLEDAVFGSLVSRDERRLLKLDGSMVEPVPGWPLNQTIKALTRFQGHVYGLIQTSDGSAIWRTDGRRSEQVISLADIENETGKGSARDLTADDRGLWLVTSGETGGRVWQSGDGRNWTARYGYKDGTAFELLIYQERVFVAGTDRERGVGMLWGSSGPAKKRPKPPPRRTENRLENRLSSVADMNWPAAGNELERLLGMEEAYRDRATSLRQHVLNLLAKDPPAGFFAERLSAAMPDAPMSLIGGAVRIPSALMGRALLLFAMAVQGESARTQGASIPSTLLQAPWTRAANQAEKYFDTLLAAA